jgi:hypothetical protein
MDKFTPCVHRFQFLGFVKFASRYGISGKYPPPHFGGSLVAALSGLIFHKPDEVIQ